MSFVPPFLTASHGLRPERQIMPDDLSPAINQRLTALEVADQRHDRDIEILRMNVQKIAETLGQTATKEDILRLETKFQAGVVDLLRDALNAQPARQSILWQALAAVATIGALIIAALYH